MADTENISSIRVALKLQDNEGKNFSVSMGNLSKDSFDNDKALAVATSLQYIFDAQLVDVVKTTTSTLE